MRVKVNQALRPGDITLGSYVNVESDLSPGMCSYGGSGFVTDVNGNGISRMFTVKYSECGTSGGMKEANICYSRLTVVPSPFASTKLARQHGSPDVLNIHQVPPLQSPPTAKLLTSIQDILASGASRGKTKGWRAKQLGVFHLGRRNERFQSLLVREDKKQLLGFLSVLPENYRRQRRKGSNGQFLTSKSKNNPCTISYLAKAWDVGRNFPLERIKKGQGQAAMVAVKKPNPTQMSVIDSLDAAKLHFSARNLFIADRVEERTNEEKVFAYDTQTRAERFRFFREEAKAEWLVAEANLRDYLEAMSRSKVA